MSDSIVNGTNFNADTQQVLTKEQLYSTASYQSRNLQGISLFGNDLTAWDFSEQDLTNGDATLDANDIDSVSLYLRSGLPFHTWYDMNQDSVLDERDAAYWVHQLADTYFGDANLDGEFNSSDFTTVFLAGEYEDGIEDNSGWAEGDWDGDGDFTSQDMVTAFLDGGYEQGPRPAAAVPEPTVIQLATLMFLALATMRKNRLANHQV